MKIRLLLTVIGGILFLCVTQTKAQWVQVNPPNFPSNNSIQCFAVIGTNLFAGSNGHGIFLSTNDGTSWAAVDSGLTNTEVRALAVSGTNLFAGTWGSGVFLSTNNGTSWSIVDTGLTNPYISSLLAQGTDIIAGTNTFAFISGNNGTNWGEISSGMSGSQIMALAASGSNLFAGTDWGVSISTDNGTSWTLADSGLTTTATYVYALAIYPNVSGGTNLFAGTDIHGVYHSTNNGLSWTAVDSGLTSNSIFSFAVSGTNLFVGTSGSGVFLSTNNGTTWTSDSAGMSNIYGTSDAYALTVSGSYLFAGNDRGVWRRPLSEMITGVKEGHNNLPANFSLKQNYPNPFNPTTIINYSLPRSNMVTIKVFDILGNEVASLVNEEKPAGSYSVNFNGNKLSSGVYFYRMKAGSFVETKKLILMK